MAKQKVSDLPKEEQDALLNETKEAGLRMGLLQGWTVETLKKRIKEAKANKQPEGENETDGETPVNEESTEDDEGDGEAPEDVTTEDGEENGDGKTPKEALPAEVSTTPTETIKTEEEKTYICHICRSRVVNGKCSGCGFSVGG